MNQKQNKFKLTPDVYKTLMAHAEQLGNFQRRDKTGKLMFREQTRVITGADVLKQGELNGRIEFFKQETRAVGFHKWIQNQKWLAWAYKLYIKLKLKHIKPVPVPGSDNIDPEKKYVQHFREPIIVNHGVNLVECYKKDGTAGVDVYVKFFNDLKNGN